MHELNLNPIIKTLLNLNVIEKILLIEKDRSISLIYSRQLYSQNL